MNNLLSGYSRRSFLNWIAASAAAAAYKPNSPEEVCFVNQRILSPALDKFLPAIDPGSDPFLCEQYAADLAAIFQSLSQALQVSPADISSLAAALAPDIAFTKLDHADAVAVRKGPAIGVDLVTFAPTQTTGRAAFLESLSSYLRAFSQIATAEFLITGLKIVSPAPLSVQFDVRYDLVGSIAGAREERIGAWKLFGNADTHGHWQIKEWHAAGETRARVAGRGFIDITADALKGNADALKQFAHGADYWRSSIDAASGIDIYGNNGIAVGDFDGDGLDDFYVCQPSGLPNRLFRNRGDGTFEDVTEKSGLALLDGTASALFADLTNSGRQDLLVVRTNGPLLYVNRGQGRFELKPDAFRFAKAPSGTFTAVAAADYNRDGLLDIYFCLYAYYQGPSQYNHPQPYYDAQNGPPNFLMRNRGDWTFEDVTESSGMNENNNRFSFACGWCDYDNDGWPDLYVANDFGRKNLYRNNRDGTFHDLAQQASVEDYGAGMSVCWLDYDNDGRQDLYVTDMYSAAGARVTSQDAFLSGVDPKIRAIYHKHASGNSLFDNQSESPSFRDTTAAARVALGRWSWSGDAWDFDHDGNTDLYVTNGFISGANPKDLASFFWRQIVSRSLDTGSAALDYQLAWNAINELIRSDYSWNGFERNVFYLNCGNGAFSEISGPLGLDFTDDSRAFALADFDGDGRLEVILKNRTGPQLRILHNEIDPIGNSVTLRLRGVKSNRDAVGAVVTLEAGSRKQTKFVQAGSGFLSQHTKDLSFGIGEEKGPLRLNIRWPSGATQAFDHLPAQHLIFITEGQAEVQSKPFTARASQAAGNRSAPPVEKLPARFESWLIEPIPAPEFSVGSVSLSQFKQKPLLLALVGAACDASSKQLSALAEAYPLFARQSVHILALSMDAAGRNSSLPFPVLTADQQTIGVYGIFYRYVFDRRRTLATPTLLLLDPNLSVFKIATGYTDPHALLNDFSVSSTGEQARLKRALPFAGQYHGAAPRRNFFTYGIAYVQSDYADAALSCFQATVARDPNYSAAYYNMGTIYLNKQMLPEAKASLEHAVALDPEDVDAVTNLGSVAGQQKDYDAAYRYFEQALRIKPNHVIALQNLVMLDRYKGQNDKAEQAIQAALAVDPNNGEFHFALGMLLANESKFDAAQTELQRAVQLRPDDSIALNNLGVVFLRLNKPNDAFQCFDRCVRIAPDYDRAVLNLASVYQQQGDSQKARDVLKNFSARHPDNAEIAKALNSLAQ